MAFSHCLTLFYLNSPGHIISIRKKPLLLARSSALSRPTTRKNYLRQKILKTLTKPYPFSVDPLVPTISQGNLRLNGFEFELPSDQTAVEIFTVTSGEVIKPEELTGWETSESAANCTGTVQEGTILRFGAYLIGVLVVQTFFAVWMMGYPNSDKKINSEGVEKMSQREFPVNRIEKLLDGNFDTKIENFVNMDDSVFEEKLKEIRAMAGAVRGAEKRQASEGVDIEDGNAISRPLYGIEKEIDYRLIKLQERKTSSGDKLPDYRVKFLNKIREVQDGVGKDDPEKETLMFKKRHKFRSSSREWETNPKGFKGKESRISKRKKKNSSSIDQAVANGNIVDDGSKLSKQANQGIAKGQDTAFGIFGEGDETNLTLQKSLFQSDDDAKKLDKRLERSSEPSNGDISTTKTFKSSKTKELRTSPAGIIEGSTRTSKTSLKASKPILSGNGAGDVKMVPMVKDKHSSGATGRWWLNLPYVLVIFIRRSSDHERLGGLFTLKIPSLAQDKKNDSYTVGFEDHGDANNFCFILESFFEDLGDFSANIVPLSRKELYESVEFNTMKIVVVKKRQIQLYVGQPFADVEMALQALVEQERNTSRDF